MTLKWLPSGCCGQYWLSSDAQSSVNVHQGWLSPQYPQLAWRQCWGTEKPHLRQSLSQGQVCVNSQKAAHALEMGGKFAVTMGCPCLQRDLAAQGVSLWVCDHSGNFTDIFLTGHTWKPVCGFPREHIKDKECYHLACPSQRKSHLCTAPAAALVWDLCPSTNFRTEAKVFCVLHVHLPTPWSPALHAWISSSSLYSPGARGSFGYPHISQKNQYLSTFNKEIKYICLACRQSWCEALLL